MTKNFNLKDFQINKPIVSLDKLQTVVFTYDGENLLITEIVGEERFNSITVANGDRPYFFQQEKQRLITIAVDQDLFDRVNELINYFKTKKSFGIAGMNKCWKVIKPLAEKWFGLDDEPIEDS